MTTPNTLLTKEDKKLVLTEGTKLPEHIAVIPDGNMRWGRKNSVPYQKALDKGVEAIFRTMEMAEHLGVKNFTAWVFSTENWKRDPEFVKYIMEKALELLLKHREEYIKNGIRFTHLGRLKDLPKALRREIVALEKATVKSSKFFFNLALNYGGHDEILRAIQKIVKAGYQAKEITKELLEQNLDTSEIGSPDLIIRTSGEKRTSGFMAWQSVYSELHYNEKLWPDFSPQDLYDAIIDFSSRDRRFGAQNYKEK